MYRFLIALGVCYAVMACKKKVKPPIAHEWLGKEVTVSAYNSVAWQTDGDPNITAWGDTLRPGMKAIAVSRDLLKQGFGHNTMVRIDTFPDTFYVKDKMHRRWKKRIDLYMGNDVQAARDWGRKKLMICYAVPLNDSIKMKPKP
jgi:3D (Asp-Asp-Asp) domain-containing protein